MNYWSFYCPLTVLSIWMILFILSPASLVFLRNWLNSLISSRLMLYLCFILLFPSILSICYLLFIVSLFGIPLFPALLPLLLSFLLPPFIHPLLPLYLTLFLPPIPLWKIWTLMTPLNPIHPSPLPLHLYLSHLPLQLVFFYLNIFLSVLLFLLLLIFLPPLSFLLFLPKVPLFKTRHNSLFYFTYSPLSLHTFIPSYIYPLYPFISQAHSLLTNI